MEYQPNRKGVVASWSVESSVVAMLDIGDALIPCVWMLRVVQAHNVYDHLVGNLCLAISLGMESRGLSKFCM